MSASPKARITSPGRTSAARSRGWISTSPCRRRWRFAWATAHSELADGPLSRQRRQRDQRREGRHHRPRDQEAGRERRAEHLGDRDSAHHRPEHRVLRRERRHVAIVMGVAVLLVGGGFLLLGLRCSASRAPRRAGSRRPASPPAGRRAGADAQSPEPTRLSGGVRVVNPGHAGGRLGEHPRRPARRVGGRAARRGRPARASARAPRPRRAPPGTARGSAPQS
jgi:hypothetical protein